MADETIKSVQPTDTSTKKIDNDLENLVLANPERSSTETTTLPAAVTPLGVPNCEISNSNSINTTIPSEMRHEDIGVQNSSFDFSQPKDQACSIATNRQVTRSNTGQHIMISYHRETSLDMCDTIYKRLRDLNYNVWMDKYDLHGCIHEAMASAIENSSIVLFCFNRQYCQSYYCIREVLYTVNSNVKFIPCLMEASFAAKGSVGIAISDQLYIDFSSPNNFEQAFQELLVEIQAVYGEEQPNKSLHPSTVNSVMCSHAGAIACECHELLNISDQELQTLTRDDLIQRMIRWRQRCFDILRSPRSPTNSNRIDNAQQQQNSRQLDELTNQQILQQILTESRNQTELLGNINKTLTDLSSSTNIIKFSLLFLFLWAIPNLPKVKSSFWS